MDDLDFYHSVPMKPPVYTDNLDQMRDDTLSLVSMGLFAHMFGMTPASVQEIHGVDANGNPRTSWQYSFVAPELTDESLANLLSPWNTLIPADVALERQKSLIRDMQNHRRHRSRKRSKRTSSKKWRAARER